MLRKAQILDRQQRVFRIAQDPTRYGLTLKMIAADANLSIDSVRNYARGETEMPMSALDGLIGVLPDELLSLLLPDGRVIVKLPDGIDHDEICKAMGAYMRDKHEAHAATSPAGPAISPCEDARLRGHLAVVTSIAA